MKTYRYRLNLQLFAEDVDTGVETAPDAGVQEETDTSQTGVEEKAAAEPEKQNNFEKAFAKRLADAQSKWEAEAAERYKGHEDYKYLADYLQQANGMDVLSLKEQIEMERLQQRAEKENLPPEVLKRLDALEAKAAKVDEFEQQQQEVQQYQEFRGKLEAISKQHDVDPDALHNFMHENQIGKFEAAIKAFKYDEVVKQREDAEKEGVKKFLTAKGSIPAVTGSTAQGQVTSPAPKTLAEARQRAMQRLSQ